MYSRDMSKLIKIYWGEGKILPQIKLNSLQNLGKEIVTKFMRKRQHRSSKDGSAQKSASKKHRMVQLAQSELLVDEDEESSELTRLSTRSEA